MRAVQRHALVVPDPPHGGAASPAAASPSAGAFATHGVPSPPSPRLATCRPWSTPVMRGCGGGGGEGVEVRRLISKAWPRQFTTCGPRISQLRPGPSHSSVGRSARYLHGRGSSGALAVHGSCTLDNRVQAPLQGTWRTWRQRGSLKRPHAAPYHWSSWPKVSNGCGPPYA